MNHTSRLALESARRLLRKGAYSHLKKILDKLHAADIALLMGQLSHKERLEIFNLLEPNKAAQVLVEMDSLLQVEVLENMEPQEILKILSHLPPDEAVDILDTLPDDKREELLPYIEEEDVDRLLSYREETAGRIMTTDYLALPEDMTVEEAIEEVRRSREEEVFYIYVVDSRNHLVGVLSLRQLILQDPKAKLKDVMNPDVIRVKVDMDQEEVARVVARYNLLAVPVVDDNNHLMGVVTVDDIIDIVQEEATEDIYKMVGTSADELWEASTLKVAWFRLPWLAFTLVGEMVSGLVIRHYHRTISEFVAVAFFVPLIMALAGAVGNQTQTIIVRAMATGRMEGMAWRILKRQLGVGSIMGLVGGVLATGLVTLVQHNLLLGASVGVSLFLSMTISSVIGVLVPVFSKRLGVDPAFTVPSIATLNDIMGTFIYLSLATCLLVRIS